MRENRARREDERKRQHREKEAQRQAREEAKRRERGEEMRRKQEAKRQEEMVQQEMMRLRREMEERRGLEQLVRHRYGILCWSASIWNDPHVWLCLLLPPNSRDGFNGLMVTYWRVSPDQNNCRGSDPVEGTWAFWQTPWDWSVIPHKGCTIQCFSLSKVCCEIGYFSSWTSFDNSNQCLSSWAHKDESLRFIRLQLRILFIIHFLSFSWHSEMCVRYSWSMSSLSSLLLRESGILSRSMFICPFRHSESANILVKDSEYPKTVHIFYITLKWWTKQPADIKTISQSNFIYVAPSK